MKMNIRMIIFWIFWNASFPIYAQQREYEIKTDEQSYYGDTMWVKKDSLCISKNGTGLCFIIDDVVSYFVPHDRKKIYTYAQHPYNTYVITSLTAFTQKQGKLMYRNYAILDHNMEYGLTNNLSFLFGNTFFTPNTTYTLYSPHIGFKGSLSIKKDKITLGGRIRYRRSTPIIFEKFNPRNVNTFTYSTLLTLGGQYNYLNFNYTVDYFEGLGSIGKLSIGAKCRLNYYTSMLLEVSSYNEKYHGLSFGVRRDFRRESINFGFFTSEATNRIPIPYFSIQYQW